MIRSAVRLRAGRGHRGGAREGRPRRRGRGRVVSAGSAARHLHRRTRDRVPRSRSWATRCRSSSSRSSSRSRRDGNKVSPREYEIPTELPTLAPRFKLVPGEAQTRLGARGVEVAWRDRTTAQPVALRFRQGQARRRTVLMELPPEDEPAPARGEVRLPADAVRRAAPRARPARRRRGRAAWCSESEYQRRRRLILENKLDEAGYGAATP